MKAIKAVFMIVLVLGVIAVGAVSFWLGRGVKLAVERYGPVIIGAPVTVGAVVLTPWSGSGTITNLVIGNPPGFKGARAVSVGSAEIKIKLSSLLTDTVVVERVAVRAPELFYEMGSEGSNLSRLQRHAEGTNAKDASSPSKSSGGKSLLIEDLLVTGGHVGLAVSAFEGQGLEITLPDVRLKNIGGKGRSPAQAVSQLLGAIAGPAGQAASGAAATALNKAAVNVLGKIGGFLKTK